MIRFEKRYCDSCITVHWMEIVGRHNKICRGKDYFPQDSATHYTRWRYGGIELCGKVSARALHTDWIFAEPVEERESVEQEQDW